MRRPADVLQSGRHRDLGTLTAQTAILRAGDRPVRIRLIGPPRVELGAELLDDAAVGSRKARILLSLLAARRGSIVDGDAIDTALWPVAPPGNAPAIVASLVSRLRRALGREVILGARGRYQLGTGDELSVDVDDVRGLLDEAAARATGGEPALALAAADAARRMLGDETALAGEPDAAWVSAVRDDVRGLRRRASHLVAGAAVASGDHVAARAAAAELLAADPLDEAAARVLMTAAFAIGETAAGLRAYEALRRRLADDLGADPAPATEQVYLAGLRGTAPRPTGPVGAPRQSDLVGRDAEVAVLRAAWADAARGSGGGALICGEAGIGKTRLAADLSDLARRTGGTVLSARCWEAERSLFLQPVVDAITGAATSLPPGRVRAAAGAQAGALARLVPEIAPLFPRPDASPDAGSDAELDASPTAHPDVEHPAADVERRRAFDAATGFLCGLARDGPVLLLLDDLHLAGTATLEMLHYAGRRFARAPVLFAATVRLDEGADASRSAGPARGVGDTLRLLEADMQVVRLGPLTGTDVTRLCEAAGQGDRSGEVMRRTGGHPLFVVETLRALAAGDSGVPESLTTAVLARVARTGSETQRLLRAGAVLGSSFDPTMAAALSGLPLPVALVCAEQALAARLLVPSGPEYQFAHDVVREVLAQSIPGPTAVAYHRQAADLLADRPEAMAVHAAAAGQPVRAARAWLLAAEQSLARFAAADAARFAGRTIVAAQEVGDAELLGRALLVRGSARDGLADYPRAYADFTAGRAAAREAGDRRLEMSALRRIAGDVPVALGRPPAECDLPLRECLTLAEALGDRTVEADVLDRLTVLDCSRLDFASAHARAQRALTAARAAGDEDALVFGLDAVKVIHAYLGNVADLAPVLDDLEPRLRRRGDLWMLQWTVFERAFVFLAAEDWPAAVAGIEAALAVCRRSGYTAQEPFFVAHLGWAHRLAGRLDEALAVGRRAVDLGARHRHIWWSTTAASLLGGTLVATGRAEEAVRLLEPARRVADVPGAEGYRLRCLGPLAEASGSADVLAEATALLASVSAPPGRAWLLGADAYLATARAWAARGERERSAQILEPFRVAAARAGWTGLVRLADAV